MDTPVVMLGKFLERHGLAKRVIGEGTPVMYGLLRSFDEQSETFAERWSVIASSMDSYQCMNDGFSAVMKSIDESVAKFAPTKEQFTSVLAIAFVTYGKAAQFEEDEKRQFIDDRNTIESLVLEMRGREMFDARIVMLANLEGFVTESTVVDDTGAVVDRNVREQLVEDDQLSLSGALDLAFVKGFMTLLLLVEVAQTHLNTNPATIARHAIHEGFPFREDLVRSMLHAIVEQIEMRDEFALTVCEMLERARFHDEDSEGDE